MTVWFFVFWSWFDFWRNHRALAYAAIAFTLFGTGIPAYVFEHRTWFGGPLDIPVAARAAGWGIIALATILGSVADRQLGLRVRSFTPFFTKQGHIELKTTGAYGFVRHPIYTAGRMFQFGIFLVTGYPSVLYAWIVFGLGSIWFSRQEEKRLIELLDDPHEYERYRERVPALFPRLIPRLKARRSSA